MDVGYVSSVRRLRTITGLLYRLGEPKLRDGKMPAQAPQLVSGRAITGMGFCLPPMPTRHSAAVTARIRESCLKSPKIILNPQPGVAS